MGCTGSTKKKKIAEEFEAEPSESVINRLLNKTKFTRQDIIEWWHGFLIDCPTGLLHKKKFIEVYQFRYPHGKPNKFCDHVFRTFHPDKRTGAIDFEHFMCAIDVSLNGSPDEKFEWAFTMYDINGDQRISKNEMSSLLESMFDLLGKDKKGANDPRRHTDRIFIRVKTKNDDYMSKEEFLLGCRNDEEIRRILAPHY